MKEKKQKTWKKMVGLIIGILVITLPYWGAMGIRYGADVYSRKRSVIINDCVVKSIVEAPREMLLVVEFPMTQNNIVIGGQLHVVCAYGKWEKDKELETGDVVTCAFPERDTGQKGYVVW